MIKLNLNKKLTKAQNGTVIPVIKHQNMFYNPDGSGGQESGTNAYSAPSPGSGGFAGEKTRNETTKDYVLRTIEAEKVDPRILGGIMVKVAGKLIDGSTQGRLAELKKSLYR